MDIITRLKQEHLDLVKALTEVKQKGIGTAEGKQKLFATKAGLLAHLEHEDKELYAILYKAAETNSELKKTLFDFADDMKKIGAEVMVFFDKYSEGSGGMEFAAGFGRVVGLLQQRILREEKKLFPAFENLNKS